jgi:hypothetical protein
MKCSICGYDENELLNKKKEAILQIDQEVARLTLEEHNLLQKWKEDNGFTDTIKEQLKQISSDLTGITIQAFLDNFSYFLKLDARLQIVKDYFDKYGIAKINRTIRRLGSVSSGIKKPEVTTGTVGAVIAQFQQEPLPERISQALSRIRAEISEYANAKCDLDKIQSFFKEKTYTPKIYGFSRSITTTLNRLYDKSHKHIFPTYSIVLCPTCSALFEEAASASFAIVEAKKMADEEIWDDDD